MYIKLKNISSYKLISKKMLNKIRYSGLLVDL